MRAALCGVYLLFLWIVSSVLRGKGLLVFGAGCVLLAATLVAVRRGRRAPFLRVWFAMALAAAATVGVEAALWLAPGLLSGNVANATLHRYHPLWDGIYDPDPYVGEIMRPNLRRRMYWNGHTWNHRTNRDGFRGPDLDHADVVFLGDSMIYGHGVEEAETVPARFQELTRCVTANLGRQGASLVQELELLRRIGLRLAPRVIVVSTHPTDPADAFERYPRGELERFLQEEGYRPRAHQPEPGSIFDWWFDHVALPLRLGRALRVVMSPHAVPGEVAVGDRPYVPNEEELARPFETSSSEERMGWDVHVHALDRIKRAADAGGARLVLMDLGYPRGYTRAMRSVASDLGVTYSDAGAKALERALAGEPIYLPRDGHWTPLGTRVVAESLAATIGSCRP